MPFAALLCRLVARARRKGDGSSVASEIPRSAAGDVARDRARLSTRERRGFALEGTIIVLVLVGALIGFAATWVVTITRGAATDYRGSRASYAAEAGADAVMSQLEVAMEDGVISTAELNALALPRLDGFTFENMVVTRDSLGMEVRPINSGTYQGLYALNLPIEIAIAARDATNNRGSVMVAVNAQSIPLFQFGVFYEGDLEIHNGPPLNFEGWVHTNRTLYLSSANSYFESRITTPDSVIWRRKNNSERLTGVYVNNDAGTRVRLDFDSRSASSDADFRSKSEAKFNSRVMTKAHGVKPLRLPLPTDMAPIELIRPRAMTDNVAAQAVKFAWKADWYIDLDISTGAALKDQNKLCNSLSLLGVATSTRPATKVLPDVASCKNIFTFKPNAFREGREDIGVDLLEIDVNGLRNWVGGNLARETRILYINFKGLSTASGQRSRDYPAVRLVNASRLPNPLTIATSAPLYVKGDYNSVSWQPSSLLGDAITFMSSGFNEGASGIKCSSDTDACSGSYTKPTANPSGGSMKIYAAIAAGHSPTPCDANRVNSCVGGLQPDYGGGLENFPRFVENWTGKTVLYRGSLVSLFAAEQADLKLWTWRSYYDAPDRDWKFDLRFQDPNNLPPGTPTVGSVFQTSFRPVF